jgi:phosphatidylserine decarboxylase
MTTGIDNASTGDAPERASPVWRATLALMNRLPQGALSRVTGRLADLALPRPFRSPAWRAFAAVTGADPAEAERPLSEYRTFDAFFTRRLKAGTRVWPADARTIGSPVDGVITQFGTVHDGVLLQAKGRPYSASGLLDDTDQAARFDGGAFLTLYLAPRDYHRIHAPVAGILSKFRHVPGALLPVNEHAIRHVAGLFPRNERVALHIDGTAGTTAVVAIGAFNVGRIEVVSETGWRTNRRGAAPREFRYDPPHPIERGDEIMIFHLGSTVVLLFEPSRIRLDAGLRTGATVRLGQAIGSAIV